MIARTALLFPGQGSQTPGMRETVERHRPDLLALAYAELGEDPFERVDDGTAYAQPAIYCASIAGWSRLGEPAADLLAGHSLGEFSALVAAGSLSAEDGLRLVALRGRLMQRAAAAGHGGGMLALRTRADVAAALGARAGLALANDNSPTQVVLSGPVEGIEAALEAATEAGIKAKRLPISGAFHSPAMESAVPELRAALAEVELRPPRIAVLSGVTAEPFDDVRRRLAEGVTRPVRWRETLLALRRSGVRSCIEVGPGKVLTRLVRKSLPGVEAQAADALEAARA